MIPEWNWLLQDLPAEEPHVEGEGRGDAGDRAGAGLERNKLTEIKGLAVRVILSMVQCINHIIRYPIVS